MNFKSHLKQAPSEPTPTQSNDSDSDAEETFHDARFPPEEEAELLSQSNSKKSDANTLFSKSRYSEAISAYDSALSYLPTYLDLELAILKSNISACHLKLSQWKEAVDAATAALEALDREDPPSSNSKDNGSNKASPKNPENDDDKVVELPSTATPSDETHLLHTLSLRSSRLQTLSRIRSKSLLRRARASSSLPPSLSTYSTLERAHSDYTRLLTTPALFSHIPPAEQKMVKGQVLELEGKVKEARERETAEMMGKLRELGDGILRPFGLSTGDFKVERNAEGGYSLGFGGGGGGGEGGKGRG
ncbi:MAG: hypothetical protein Q9227_006135 [Pyrenula ochraceoflavens]